MKGKEEPLLELKTYEQLGIVHVVHVVHSTCNVKETNSDMEYLLKGTKMLP
jgi:hypothetical protein